MTRAYHDLCARWRAANRPFEENGCDGTPVAHTTVALKRPSPLCLVSVHAINHYRADGSIKPADLNTGGLAIALAEAAGASVVYNTYRHPAISAWGKATATDGHIAALAAARPGLIVLDLHGVRDNMGFDIAIGTAVKPPNTMQKAMIDTFLPLAAANGLRVVINPAGYSADGAQTVTFRALRHTPRCLQFEFSRACRASDGTTRQSRAMLRTMDGFLKAIAP